ncbi:MAG: PilT/PilU family type 4a pilus ATPase [Candidatus Omnitrophica bacterium]|nr:PilT/PilU family type 4a pilus ATPase [Candidatus Omnitrophota bacterium]MCB9747489.1 PilT/PilU family type 4a pilus ATPase [Candidatus Omnitrophota bacterium]
MSEINNENSERKSALASISGLNTTTALPRNFVGIIGDGECKTTPPNQLSAENSLDEILTFARKIKATDIHLCVNNPIILRMFGALKIASKEKLTAENTKRLIESCLTTEQLTEFLDYGDLQFVYIIEGAGRFRMTLMKQRFGWDLTVRLIPMTIASFEESKMPAACKELTKWAQGLVLVTGPIGCGKTSTLSTLVQMVNQSRLDHIITIENPIEIPFRPDKCQITQREVNTHTLSQANALRAALREDPDILVISELRDLESIQLAVSAAETGHLVFGTMNTNDAAQTISTLINSFPPDERAIVTNMISESLRGVISQQLVPKKDGSGVVAAYEVLIVTPAIANIMRKGQMQQINNAMTTGKSQGMTLLDESLEALVKSNIISAEEALVRAINPATIQQYMNFNSPAPGEINGEN